MWDKVVKIFMEKIWPYILKLLIKLAQEILSYIFEKLESFIKQYFDNKEKEYNRKANESYYAGQSSTTDEERKKHEEAANMNKVREEMMREMRKEFSSEFDEKFKEMEKDIVNATSNMKANETIDLSKKDDIKLRSDSVLKLES